jgi:hypothetical protein
MGNNKSCAIVIPVMFVCTATTVSRDRLLRCFPSEGGLEVAQVG